MFLISAYRLICEGSTQTRLFCQTVWQVSKFTSPTKGLYDQSNPPLYVVNQHFGKEIPTSIIV